MNATGVLGREASYYIERLLVYLLPSMFLFARLLRSFAAGLRNGTMLGTMIVPAIVVAIGAGMIACELLGRGRNWSAVRMIRVVMDVAIDERHVCPRHDAYPAAGVEVADLQPLDPEERALG